MARQLPVVALHQLSEHPVVLENHQTVKTEESVREVVLMMVLGRMTRHQIEPRRSAGKPVILPKPDMFVLSSSIIVRSTKHPSGKAAAGQGGPLFIESSESNLPRYLMEENI
jgi:hypothetical protein